MKKAVTIFFALLLMLLPGCSQQGLIPVEGATGVQLYSEFLDRLHSGRLQKIRYSFHSWYEFCTSEATDIQFITNSEGKRELLYRDRTPFVIWDWPAYDYYDGDTYYYKYKNQWYTDQFSKYERVQQQDFIGIRENFFLGNNVLSDVVYRDGKGYRMLITIQSPSMSYYYTVTGRANENGDFSTIRIKAFQYSREEGKYVNTSSYLYRYSHVNEDKALKVPQDLNLADLESVNLSGPGSPSSSSSSS